MVSWIFWCLVKNSTRILRSSVLSFRTLEISQVVLSFLIILSLFFGRSESKCFISSDILNFSFDLKCFKCYYEYCCSLFNKTYFHMLFFSPWESCHVFCFLSLPLRVALSPHSVLRATIRLLVNSSFYLWWLPHTNYCAFNTNAL